MKRETSTVRTKGRPVIPAKLRRKYAIREGTGVAITEEENRLILQPLTLEFIRRLRGSLRAGTLEMLYEERTRER
jgi:AbrB family looped-hinge helix DNA binding protein